MWKMIQIGLILQIGAMTVLAEVTFEEPFEAPYYRTFDESFKLDDRNGVFNFPCRQDSTEGDLTYKVGIDTLWAFPKTDTSKTFNPTDKWDVGVCPDGQCIGYFHNETGFQAKEGLSRVSWLPNAVGQHHIQYQLPININTGEPGNITQTDTLISGALLYTQSTTTGKGDTVFVFATWKLEWDPDALPPRDLSETGGELPKRHHFFVNEKGKVAYDPTRAPNSIQWFQKRQTSNARGNENLFIPGSSFRQIDIGKMGIDPLGRVR